jgi:hypothetical protein
MIRPLLLCSLCAIAVLLVRSWYRCDGIVYQRTDNSLTPRLKRVALIESKGGAIFITYYSVAAGTPLGFVDGLDVRTDVISNPSGSPPTLDLIAVRFWRHDFSSGKYQAISMSYWIGITLLVCCPSLHAYLRRRITDRRRARGLCPRCRYDVRGGHLSCPECGLCLSAKAGSLITRSNER